MTPIFGEIKMTWKDILKNEKPDYLDFDKDGDTEEPMTEALESAKKSQKYYTKDGKEWKGPTHKMPDGSLMTENPHNEKSVKLYRKEDL